MKIVFLCIIIFVFQVYYSFAHIKGFINQFNLFTSARNFEPSESSNDEYIRQPHTKSLWYEIESNRCVTNFYFLVNTSMLHIHIELKTK